MTTELEKQFFETFEIPKIYKTTINIGDLDVNLKEIQAPTLKELYEIAQYDFTTPIYFSWFKRSKRWSEVYPQITDRHYLELERICGEIVWYMGDSLIYEIDKKENKAVDFRHKYYAKEYSDRIYITGLTKKEALLKLCINSYIKEKIKHQVQELFKGE